MYAAQELRRLIIVPRPEVREGDYKLGSVCPSVRLFVRLSVRHALSRPFCSGGMSVTAGARNETLHGENIYSARNCRNDLSKVVDFED